ncbi:MAG TPA: cytochrome c [Terriglobales bacterium]|nr:cytochrome c [Terriglobales bacterium]
MKRFLLGVVVGVLLVLVVVYGYFRAGMAPVAASAPAMPFEKRLARMALHARLEKEMPQNVPVPANETTYMAGAMVYSDHCAVCHGAPGKPMPVIAKGMFPHPPQLFKGKGVTDDPPGETYWKVANGIRLSGMPAFKSTLSENEMWQVSVLLANADKASDMAKSMITGHARPAVAR